MANRALETLEAGIRTVTETTGKTLLEVANATSLGPDDQGPQVLINILQPVLPMDEVAAIADELFQTTDVVNVPLPGLSRRKRNTDEWVPMLYPVTRCK